MSPCVFSFEEGHKDMKDVLGGKGANLAEMTNLGLPVPPGFTITTAACLFFLREGKYPQGFQQELDIKLHELEIKISKQFGNKDNPLLISVRSGSKFSMPGMMDTVLNLGLNDETVQGLVAKTNNERFCFDAYRRFIQMFGNVVLNMNHEHFEEAMDELKAEKRVKLDTELDAKDLQELVIRFKELVKKDTGRVFPIDPKEQLRTAIEAVFHSWNSKRAKTYRTLHAIPEDLGTAVNIQAMVFGNMGEDSGTGVAFTRNPATGENVFYGEFLMNAQGEDVVAGIRTPLFIEELKKKMPRIYDELVVIRKKLEYHYQDMQDIEFTIENGRLFILQTRNGKRTTHAAVKIAVDMVDEKLISREEAVLRIDPKQLSQLLHPSIDPKAQKKIIAKGLPASPGAASGKVVFTADEAYQWADRGEKVILVRKETTPEDIHGMHAAQGILTATGGMTSHAAVVCRGMGKCCVAGCSDITVSKTKKQFSVEGITIQEGDIITLDGSTGEVILGEVATLEPTLTGDFRVLMKWADTFRSLKVRANADTPIDAKKALEFGAEGIGLCRTEHMFFNEERIKIMREMILSTTEIARRKALSKLLPFQKGDFMEIFRVMDGLPVTIRLLDPPLHEFMPEKEEHIEALAKEMNISVVDLKDVISKMHEVNPMLGHRGCRLGVTYPEIYEMQVRAILEAGIEVSAEGIQPFPEIEVPLVGHVRELQKIKKRIECILDEIRENVKFSIKIGTMIELPRACLTADDIAPEADFFSFGTNDLTQMVFGLSRDDAGKFLPKYVESGILKRDPTESIDQKGVGRLMQTCVELARGVKSDLEIGICGEHGGEPDSVQFCHRIGLNYVSCSPYRVPLARLAAAHAALIEKAQYEKKKASFGHQKKKEMTSLTL
ncbi:pyruvate, phosphate dikinase [Candidatus Peregrinibacteria bacterium]|nr:pyruvate, phosphate dikinase [Candidatus Peregrinibacteria bacterium]